MSPHRASLPLTRNRSRCGPDSGDKKQVARKFSTASSNSSIPSVTKLPDGADARAMRVQRSYDSNSSGSCFSSASDMTNDSMVQQLVDVNVSNLKGNQRLSAYEKKMIARQVKHAIKDRKNKRLAFVNFLTDYRGAVAGFCLVVMAVIASTVYYPLDSYSSEYGVRGATNHVEILPDQIEIAMPGQDAGHNSSGTGRLKNSTVSPNAANSNSNSGMKLGGPGGLNSGLGARYNHMHNIGWCSFVLGSVGRMVADVVGKAMWLVSSVR